MIKLSKDDLRTRIINLELEISKMRHKAFGYKSHYGTTVNGGVNTNLLIRKIEKLDSYKKMLKPLELLSI